MGPALRCGRPARSRAIIVRKIGTDALPSGFSVDDTPPEIRLVASDDREESGRRLKLGIFGGTFNPIHHGHLLVAQDALEAFSLSRVLFIPCASPPHKVADCLVSARHRLAMIRLAIRGNPHFACSDLEIRRGGVSYTMDTVRALRRLHPAAELYLLIGSDSLGEFHQWRQAADLVRHCTLIAAWRPGGAAGRFPRLRLRGAKVLRLTAHSFAVSSSEIRQRVRAGRSIRYLVPDAVAAYLVRHRLYRKENTSNP